MLCDLQKFGNTQLLKYSWDLNSAKIYYSDVCTIQILVIFVLWSHMRDFFLTTFYNPFFTQCTQLNTRLNFDIILTPRYKNYEVIAVHHLVACVSTHSGYKKLLYWNTILNETDNIVFLVFNCAKLGLCWICN